MLRDILSGVFCFPLGLLVSCLDYPLDLAKPGLLYKKYWVFTNFTFSCLFGFFFGNLMSMKPNIILLDKLGKEYVLSRQVKQKIFTGRKDISNELRNEVYLKMQMENEEKEKLYTKNNIYKH
jgi:hypothetical protein